MTCIVPVHRKIAPESPICLCAIETVTQPVANHGESIWMPHEGRASIDPVKIPAVAVTVTA